MTLVLKIPMRYFDKNASAEDKETLEYYKQWIQDLNDGVERGYLLPQAFDPESRQPLFEIVDTERV